MTILVRGGDVVTASDTYRADILIEHETICKIAQHIDVSEADEVIDAGGAYVLPGGVDPHTHLDAPIGGTRTADTYATGTVAAAHGGTTTVLNFFPAEGDESLSDALERVLATASDQVAIDYGLHIILTRFDERISKELEVLADRGVTSLKVFMAYPGQLMVDDGSLFRILRRGAELGMTCCVHAENGPVIDVLIDDALAAGHTSPGWHGRTRPELAEAEATHRAIAIAELANASIYLVHLSCTEALEEVIKARDLGRAVFAETCPHYLFLDDSVYEGDGLDVAKFVLTPPLRSKRHHDALWRALRTNHLQVVSTDHCPFCISQKMLGQHDFSVIPNGAPGIEHRLALLYSEGVLPGYLSLQRMVEIFAAAPARIFGLYPRKGTIAVGSDADLVVFDPTTTTTISAASHHMNVDYSLYEGRSVQGSARTVISADDGS